MNITRKSVLIVEDDFDARYLLKFLIEAEGYIVYEAENGVRALEAVAAKLPDVILMDMSMPEMDGLTATKELRKKGETASLPIIAVTAHGSLYLERALEAGCNELVAKPLDFETLDRILVKYLASKKGGII